MILNIGIEVYIFIGLVVLLFIFIMIVLPQIKYNNAKKRLQTYPNFKEYKKEYYDFTIENEEVKLYIKMIDIPKNSMITINSKTTWCLQYGGSSSDPGRAYPNKKYLDELKPFLKHDFTDEKQTHKVILLNISTEKITRYLNESELDVVNFAQKVYDYKIIEVSKLEEHLKLLGIK